MKPKKSLKGKLTNVINTISDNYFYEKEASKNVVKYMKLNARKEGVSLLKLCFQISKKEDSIRVNLFHYGKLIREVSIKELIEFFVGSEVIEARLIDVEQTILIPLKVYINELAVNHSMEHTKLKVLIFIRDHEPVVKIFNETQLLQNISIKELVKRFKQV